MVNDHIEPPADDEPPRPWRDRARLVAPYAAGAAVATAVVLVGRSSWRTPHRLAPADVGLPPGESGVRLLRSGIDAVAPAPRRTHVVHSHRRGGADIRPYVRPRVSDAGKRVDAARLTDLLVHG